MNYYNKIVNVIMLLICSLLFAGCSLPESFIQSLLKDDLISSEGVEKSSEKITEIKETQKSDSCVVIEEPIFPTHEEILAEREKALDGVDADLAYELTDFVKYLNLDWEYMYLYQDIFSLLEDQDSQYWRKFNETGTIIIGYNQDGTSNSFYNKFDTDSIIERLKRYAESIKDETFKEDIQCLINEYELASSTHDVEHANNIYKILHDMDYYLLRSGREEMIWWVTDMSTVRKYYGVLKVYNE